MPLAQDGKGLEPAHSLSKSIALSQFCPSRLVGALDRSNDTQPRRLEHIRSRAFGNIDREFSESENELLGSSRPLKTT